MNRRKLFEVGLALMGCGLTTAFAYDKHQGKGNSRRGREDDQGENQEGKYRETAYFRADDYGYVRQYYGGPSNLPPGLRKKLYRTGTLPPGWQKRFQPFPPVLVERLLPPPPYCDRGYIDGYAVVYDKRTRIIVDVLDIIGAAMQR